MKLSERAEEILETLWTGIVEEKKKGFSLGLAEREEAITELLKGEYIDISTGEVRLKEKGMQEGKKIVRRHRLAERLLVDVLDVADGIYVRVGKD